MNRKQRVVVAVALGILMLALLFPPWSLVGFSEWEFGFLFRPPRYIRRVDFGILAFELALIGIGAAEGLIMFGGRRK